MQKLPIGIQTFSEIRNKNYLYIDKTEYIHRLVNAGKYFFFARPRRFGKSLLLDTMQEVFEGNRQIFNGLWIENKIEWESFPVVRIDFSKVVSKTGNIDKNLVTEIKSNAQRLGVDISEITSSEAFRELLVNLCAKYGDGNIVLLIDEYDKALVDYLDENDTFNYNQELLRAFYTNIKSHDKCIKFAFLAGVSKIGKLSLFSGLNNIRDISLSDDFANMCGISQEELEKSFQLHIEAFASKQSFDKEFLLKHLKLWYNGYSWDAKETLYNPYSLLNVFTDFEFNNYWYATGTPTMLTKMVQQNQRLFDNFRDHVVGSDLSLTTFDVQSKDDIGLMFQTGYLTVKEIVRTNSIVPPLYKLGFPNLEVETSFAKHLLADYIDISPELMSNDLSYPLIVALTNNDLPAFIAKIEATFARIPYHLFIEKEAFYHSILLILMLTTGFQMRAEEASSGGRSDLVIETPDRIFIFEFKLNQTANDALIQIKVNGYANPYLVSGKKITLVGINFSDRKLENWVSENL
jgi:Predicted AAA-ATPase/PD-(D/E)XK nuclease superfamily